MDSICTRCVLRLQRAAQGNTCPTTTRAFSHTSQLQRHHGVPVFKETSNPDLDTVLATMRTKHFIPAYVSKPERRLIFGTKNRQNLLDNPPTVSIGDEDIKLEWIDRLREIPNRTKLAHRALSLMAEGEAQGWMNLPALLTGLKKANKEPLSSELMEKVVRKAISCGRIGPVVQCLQQSHLTGMTLKREEVLQHVVCGLHATAQKDGWTQEATAKALKLANQVALMLEDEEHGGERHLRPHDPRQRPEILGVFLELAAVNAYKHQAGRDVGGKVKSYADRFMSCISNPRLQPQSHAPPASGPVWEMLYGVPIWHGLRLSMKVLEDEMPQKDVAEKVMQDYKAGLTILAQAIEAQRPKEGSYGDQALRAWRECIRD